MMLRVLGGLALVILVLLLGAAVALWPPAPLPAPEPGVVLHDVTLIEPGERRRAGHSLVVRDDRIASVAPAEAAAPPGAIRGGYVLAGLNDAHAHFPPQAIPGQSELFAFLFLYHGVTGVRDPGDVDGTSAAAAREGLESGAFPGPRIRQCGPFVDGEPAIWPNTLAATDPASARAAARRVAAEGYDCIKAYERLSRESLAALRDEADQLGLPVIGHVPYHVPFDEAKLDDAQHLIGVAAPRKAEYVGTVHRYPDWVYVDDARIDEVIRASLAAGTAHTPTLVTLQTLAFMDDYQAARALPVARLLPRAYRDVVWHPSIGVNPARVMTPEGFEAMRAALPTRGRVVKRLHEAGVEIRSGTDTLVVFLVPGAALHQELRLLVEAGLTPEQALATSTRNAARVFEVEGLGRLEPGAPADLVVFGSDPTVSLDALDDITGVVRAGRYWSRAELEAQLARYQAYAGGLVYDFVSTFAARQALTLFQ